MTPKDTKNANNLFKSSYIQIPVSIAITFLGTTIIFYILYNVKQNFHQKLQRCLQEFWEIVSTVSSLL